MTGETIVKRYRRGFARKGDGLFTRTSVWVLAVVLLAMSGEADAKKSWDLLYDTVGDGNVIFDLYAVDEQNVWAVGFEDQGTGSPSVGLRSTDGRSFGRMSLPSMGGGQFEFTFFSSIAFSDSQNGWLFSSKVSFMGAEHVLWKSSNGGMSWSEDYEPSEEIHKMQAIPTGELFAVGEDTILIFTPGEGYSEITVPVPAGHSLSDIFMFNAECGFTVASTSPEDGPVTGAVLWTTDSGRTWEIRAQGLPYMLGGISFVTADMGWIAAKGADAGYVLKTTDGGRNWTPQSLPDHDNPVFGSSTSPVTECRDVRFFDDMRGVALCLACTGNCEPEDEDSPSYYTVLSWTQNGGSTWEMDPDYEEHMNAGPFGDMVRASGMFAMAFPSPNAGFMAGENNLVLGYKADSPEEPGWPKPGCAVENGNGNGNGNGNDNGNDNGVDLDGDLSRQLSGCGCGGIPLGSSGSFFLFLFVLFFLPVFLRRRA